MLAEKENKLLFVLLIVPETTARVSTGSAKKFSLFLQSLK